MSRGKLIVKTAVLIVKLVRPIQITKRTSCLFTKLRTDWQGVKTAVLELVQTIDYTGFGAAAATVQLGVIMFEFCVVPTEIAVSRAEGE